MIAPALLAGTACLLLAAFEAWRHPGDGYATLRLPVAGVWAATWLCYGLNPAAFPSPGAWTLLVLAVACAGALLTCPRRGPVEAPRGQVVPALESALLTVAVLVVAWDLWHIGGLVLSNGLTPGLVQYRVLRIMQTGEFSVPGIEVLHAAVTASGALGFGQWLVDRRRGPLVLAACGFAVALLSTGRWEVVAYVIWLMAIYTFAVGRPRLRALVSQGAVYVLLAVFFVAHGQLLGKVDGATALANASSAERAEVARADLPTVRTGGLRHGESASRARVVPAAQPCQRWQDGEGRANMAFRSMSRVERVLVLYFAGPLATLDRALCEGRVAERVVLMYWPNKVARLVGLRPPEVLLAVDPFLDIGIPFNNHTVIYQFLSEVGPMSGLIAWLAFGALVGMVCGGLLRSQTVGGLVAGTAPVAMAIRTPWTNTFFDGTLLVWMAVALSPLVVTLVLARARRR